jgi:hypothetical protein
VLVGFAGGVRRDFGGVDSGSGIRLAAAKVYGSALGLEKTGLIVNAAAGLPSLS